MIAAVFERFGPPEVMKLKEVEKPDVDENIVLIDTKTTSVNMIDIIYRSGMKAAFGLARLETGIFSPKLNTLGFDIAGEIVEMGEKVTNFEIGDRVYGGAAGANAEYTRAHPSNIGKMSQNMSYKDAGVMPVTALSALQGLRDSGEIESGQNILIYGASGGIGTYAVQLAKIFDATVTGVASGKNEKLVYDLGADNFVDYTKDPYVTKSDNYDLIFDAVGKIPISSWKTGIKNEGFFVTAGSPYMSMIRFVFALLGNSFRGTQFRNVDAQYVPEDLEFLANLVEKGELKPIIDKSYSLDEIADAHHYYERGHTAGKILVEIKNNSK